MSHPITTRETRFRKPGAKTAKLALLASLLAVLFIPNALAIGPGSDLKVTRLILPELGRTRQSGLATLAKEIRLQTSIDVALQIHEIRITDKHLFLHPFLILVGDRAIKPLSTTELTRLKAWLEGGGTLFVDNVGVSGPSEPFDLTFRREMERMFPGEPIRKISPDHVLYRSFYRVDYPAGRVIARPHLEGVSIDGRLAVIYSQNDIIGAWCRDDFGGWEYDVLPGGNPQRTMALRLGINLIEYTLCQDYKDDQVHLDYLLHKRKWKINVPTTTP